MGFNMNGGGMMGMRGYGGFMPDGMMGMGGMGGFSGYPNGMMGMPGFGGMRDYGMMGCVNNECLHHKKEEKVEDKDGDTEDEDCV